MKVKMSAFVREWCEETSATKRVKKVPPALEPEDDPMDDEGTLEDEEIDETFLALQKLLMNMEGTRLSQVASVNLSSHANNPANTHHATSSNISNSCSSQPQTRSSQEEMLESRRREREQFRHLLFSKSTGSSRRRCPAYYCFEDDEDEEDAPAPSVESTISNRMMNGSFSRYSVHVISRDRWAKEETEHLPIVLLPKSGKISSPADNPKLNVTHTAEYIDLSEQLDAKLKSELKDHVCYLTPPRSTWCIQMRDFEALQC